MNYGKGKSEFSRNLGESEEEEEEERSVRVRGDLKVGALLSV